MAERVEIMVVATDAASQTLRGIASNFGSIGNIVQSLTGGRVFEELAGQIIKFGKESVDATVKYANEVRALSMVSGESAEETSRLLQVLDDYKISANDAMTATRAMTKEGLVPNIDTLARLSDEYLSITDKQKQNEFVIKNLGRAGLEWVEVLNLGGEAIRSQGAAIDENLVLTDEMLRQARELEFAQDELNDQWEAAKIQLGTQLIPVLTDFLSVSNESSRALKDETSSWEMMIPAIGGTHSVIIAIREALERHKEKSEESARATEELANSSKNATVEIQLTEAEIKAITQASEGFLSTVGKLTTDLSSYEEKHNDIQRELNEGNITLQEAEQQWNALANEQEKASQRMILNMLQQQLAVDGLNEKETAYLLDTGLKWGIYSQKAVQEAQRAQEEVRRLTNEFNSVPDYKSSTIDVVTNYISNFISNTLGGGRAGGGDVTAGMIYRVNETRQEYFQPSMSGTVVPLGASGRGGNGQGMTFVYSPQMSLGSSREAETVIMPFVEQAIRRMQSDGRSAM